MTTCPTCGPLVVLSVGDQEGSTGYVATRLTFGRRLPLNLKRWEPPMQQGSCGHPARLYTAHLLYQKNPSFP